VALPVQPRVAAHAAGALRAAAGGNGSGARPGASRPDRPRAASPWRTSRRRDPPMTHAGGRRRRRPRFALGGRGRRSSAPLGVRGPVVVRAAARVIRGGHQQAGAPPTTRGLPRASPRVRSARARVGDPLAVRFQPAARAVRAQAPACQRRLSTLFERSSPLRPLIRARLQISAKREVTRGHQALRRYSARIRSPRRSRRPMHGGRGAAPFLLHPAALAPWLGRSDNPADARLGTPMGERRWGNADGFRTSLTLEFVLREWLRRCA
jgi:hypothetical protein